MESFLVFLSFHGKKPGDPTACCGEELQVWVLGAVAPIMAFSLEEPRSLLRGSSLDRYLQDSAMIKGQNPFVVSVK